MKLEKLKTSPYLKFLPGLLIFLAFLVTKDLHILTFAAAFILWPTFRSIREY